MIDKYNEYTIFHCLQCDVVFSDHMRNPGKTFYENHYQTRIVEHKILRWAHRCFLKKPPIKSGKILDIGCGRGDFLYEARKKGFEVVGVDIDKNSLSKGRELYGLEELYEIDVNQIDEFFNDKKFDVITFFEVLEHLDSPLDFIKRIKSLLKTNGYIVLSVPNRGRLIKSKGDRPPKHFTRWNEKAVDYFIKANGFKSIFIKKKAIGFEEINSVLGIYGLTSLRKKVEQRLTTFYAQKRQPWYWIFLHKIINYGAMIKRFMVLITSIPLIVILRILKKEGSTIYAVGILQE